MAKAGDLIGRSGGAGYGPRPKPAIKPIVDKNADKLNPSHPDFKPPKDVVPPPTGQRSTGGPGATGVRPKV